MVNCAEGSITYQEKDVFFFCLGEMFYRYLLGLFESVGSIISLFSFCLDDLSIGESGVLKSPSMNVGVQCV